MTEKEKMLAGKIYDCMDEELFALRIHASELCTKYNSLPESDPKRKALLKEIFPHSDETLFVRGPIYVDYGRFTTFGKNCFINYNMVILDVCPVSIGNSVLFGPNVSIITAVHPLIAEERKVYFDEEKHYQTDKEYAKPIKIGNNCWFGSNVTILPGVTIEDNVVVGAGSVVTHNLKSGAIYVGNPAKKMRDITKEDSIYLKKELW